MKNLILFLFLIISTGIQAQKMIHELPAKTNVDSTNWLFLTGNPTSGKLYKITAANLRDSIAPATDTTSLSNRINLKLNATDTASLSTRIDSKLSATDTASLSTRIDSKQATLVSGTNLKTVNGSTLLGSGDLVIAGGASADGDSSWYIVTDYGADKTGVADATAEIQAAIDAAEITGGIVYIPRGIYKVTATLTVRESDVTIMGEGRVSELRATGDYGDVLDVAPTTEPSSGGEFSHIKLSDFYISTTVSRTSGYGIFTNWTEQLIVHNVYIGEIHRDNAVPKFYNGLSLQNQSNCAISGTIITARNYGIYVTGTSKSGVPFTGNNFDGVLSGNNIITGDHTYTSPGSVGIYIAGGTGGFQIEESNIAFYYNNIKVDRSYNGVINRELFINHAFASDNSDGAGIVIDTNALQLFQMTGGWSAGAGRGTGTPKHGIYINDTNATLRTVITGGTIYENDGAGIYAGGGLISITGVQMWNNDVFDIVLGPNITSASITGGRASTLDDNSAITAIIKGVDGLADNPPTPGAIGGTIANNQVAFGNGTDAIQGNSTFTYDGANNLVAGTNFRVATNSGVIGELSAGTSIDSYTGGASLIFLASPASPGTAKMQFGSYNGSWRSKIELQNGSDNLWLLQSNVGNVGIATPSPTARLHLPAGSISASSAPLKLGSGTVMSTPEDGAIEYNGTHFYGTIGSTRHQLDQQVTNQVAGSNTQVQFNNSGVFGASANFTWDGTTVSLANSTTTSSLKIGTLEVQSHSLSNSWFGDNVYFDGASFKARATGPSSLFYFQGDEGQFRLGASVTAGSAFTQKVPLKASENGSVSIGGNSSPVGNTYTGGTALFNNDGMSIGKNGSAPVASALIEMTSVAKGFLPPRMTAAQAGAISSPAEGLLVYVTDTDGTFTAKGWWGWDGSAWAKLNN